MVLSILLSILYKNYKDLFSMIDILQAEMADPLAAYVNSHDIMSIKDTFFFVHFAREFVLPESVR